MEMMRKTARTLLITVASRGPEGVEVEELYRILSPLFGKERVAEELGTLIEKGYVFTVNDGGKLRLIAPRDVRKSLANLEIQRQKIAAYLKGLKEHRADLEKMDKKELSEKITIELYALVGSAIVSLLGSHEEVTIPEFLETLDRLNQVLFSKLRLNIVKDEDIADEIVKVVGTYMGKSEADTISAILQAKRVVKEKINKHSTETNTKDEGEARQTEHNQGASREYQQEV